MRLRIRSSEESALEAMPRGTYRAETLPTRLHSKILKDASGCWNWFGAHDSDGYGFIGHVDKLIRAHRVAWLIYRGEIPEGMQVLHRCDNPPCCNPDHLFLGTVRDNMKDKMSKNRWRGGSKLKESDIRKIRALRASGGKTKVIAKRFSITRCMVWSIVARRSWKHVA